MQLASIAASARPAIPAAPLATADFNVHVLRTSEPEADGTYTVTSQNVTVDPANRDGGFVFATTYFPNGYVRAGVRHIQGSDAERAAAAAVRDAILASGLLAEAKPSDWIGKPAAGFTRIYLDRRSTFVEFKNEHPTPAAQAVLDAVAAWAKLR